ncbi:MAG: hypothetical protein KGL34_07260 [Gammaproteobacteria bacterium]|nr:hypothetical protein [Gammaproteobacteria bacterium]
MDNRLDSQPLRAGGVTVELDRSTRVAALRYFDGATASTLVRTVLGEPLPEVQRVIRSASTAGEPFILAWRGPRETWILAASEGPLERLEAACAGKDDVCLVVQTDGILGIHASGTGTPELLRRLGSFGSVPHRGEARTGRFADVAVTVLGLDDREALLLVERVYAEHLLGWVRETLLDMNGGE